MHLVFGACGHGRQGSRPWADPDGSALRALRRVRGLELLSLEAIHLKLR